MRLPSRDASVWDPTDGSRLLHIRIRPSGSNGKGALGVFELNFKSVRIDVVERFSSCFVMLMESTPLSSSR